MDNFKLQKRFLIILVVLFSLLIISMIFSISIGSLYIKPSDAYSIIVNKLYSTLFNTSDYPIGDSSIMSGSTFNVIWKIRFPRILLALFVGAGLALCGTVMQASVQNPLAEPYILGISSGASLGATFSILIGFGSFSLFSIKAISFWAFIGAIVSSILVMTLSSLGGRPSSAKLILSGTVVNALCTALSNFIISIASNAEGMQTVKFWTMGSLASAKWENILFPSVTVFLAVLFFLTQSRNLNTMLLGDEVATTLGINLNFYRKLYMIVTSLITGILVSISGIIGFVGLIVPHIVRSIVGADHRYLTLISALCGAIFLIWADCFARIVIPNSELSIGIVTSLVGAPFFMYILIKKNYGFGDK